MNPKPETAAMVPAAVLSRRDLLRAGAGATARGLAALANSRAAEAVDPFLVKPYLQLGDAPRLKDREQMSVVWHTDDDDARWSLEVRASVLDAWMPAGEAHFNRVAVETIPPHRVYRATASGLSPGGQFDYRVLRDGQVAFLARGQTRRPASETFRCVVMADCGTASPGQKKVAVQVFQRKPDFVLIPGDIVYSDGRISEYRPFVFPIYNADEALPDSGAPLWRSIPFFGGLGQHDTGRPLDRFPDGFAYYMYWSLPMNGPVREVGGRNVFPLGGTESQRKAVLEATGDRYPRMANYSFDYGNSHWTVLDSWNPHIDWNDPNLRKWLKEDLTTTDATWKFVSSYLPPFNSSTEYPHTQKMRVVADILQEADVDIVFCGYAHSYQVTYPLKFTAKPALSGPVTDPGHEISGDFEFDHEFDGKTRTTTDGILYITTGGGGNPNLHSPEQTDNPKTWQEFTVKYNASVNQFSYLEIEGRRLTLRQIDLDGNLIDQIVLTKSERSAL